MSIREPKTIKELLAENFELFYRYTPRSSDGITRYEFMLSKEDFEQTCTQKLCCVVDLLTLTKWYIETRVDCGASCNCDAVAMPYRSRIEG